MLNKAIKYTKIIRNQKNKCRFISSRILMKSGASKNVVFNRNSYKLRFHPSSLTASLWVNPKERLCEEHFIASLVKEGDTVIDVGANIGTIALTLAKKTLTNNSVYAFEPHPKVFKYLKDNISLNKMEDKIKCYCVALGDQEGKLHFSDKSDDSNNAISDKGDIEVEVKRLDDAIDAKAIKLLKIDVEGYEYQVLKGAQETCKNAEIIYLECISSMLEANGGSEEKICDLLTNLDFKIYQVIDEQLVENTIGSHKKKMLLAKKQ